VLFLLLKKGEKKKGGKKGRGEKEDRQRGRLGKSAQQKSLDRMAQNVD